ncbi:MAG TPA: Co2+/Mg2+ efflux protein ApaG [Gammaproteobacteria bacterium]|jgi:ApaG protein|nr:Co2+/Mg2+ efflux protein ApaG [Gammaproteobacteria bacterium]HCG70041.1 Co2+/Mg2+ efflux protein ApaG [Gammaproteobacteria bacterium]|tara:strand:- start:762 stop:1145 length:384 start_codon:yes stop_codon:yes gene_type:complete
MQSGSSQPIEVAVEVQYLQQESAPDAERYVFAYTITISNLGSVPSQLLNRHWIITDGRGDVQEVEGPGVIGQQPWLGPGEQFTYSSGAVLKTPVGTMQGSYEFRTDSDERFDVPIEIFSLRVANMVH